MKNKPVNKFKCVMLAKSANEGFSRMLVASFASQLDPKINELADLKTAVSEAVTNAIVHAYPSSEIPAKSKLIYITAEYFADGKLCVVIKDKGKGIENLQKAMEPLYTTAPEEERSGMGFTIMESFTDSMSVKSKPGKGTSVKLIKKLTV